MKPCCRTGSTGGRDEHPRRGAGRRGTGDGATTPAGSPNGHPTLRGVRSGTTVRVVRINGGRRLVHRLAALGLVPGARVTVTRSRGPALLAINGTRLAIGRGAAMAVEVEELQP